MSAVSARCGAAAAAPARPGSTARRAPKYNPLVAASSQRTRPICPFRSTRRSIGPSHKFGPCRHRRQAAVGAGARVAPLPPPARAAPAGRRRPRPPIPPREPSSHRLLCLRASPAAGVAPSGSTSPGSPTNAQMVVVVRHRLRGPGPWPRVYSRCGASFCLCLTPANAACGPRAPCPRKAPRSVVAFCQSVSRGAVGLARQAAYMPTPRPQCRLPCASPPRPCHRLPSHSPRNSPLCAHSTPQCPCAPVLPLLVLCPSELPPGGGPRLAACPRRRPAGAVAGVPAGGFHSVSCPLGSSIICLHPTRTYCNSTLCPCPSTGWCEGGRWRQATCMCAAKPWTDGDGKHGGAAGRSAVPFLACSLTSLHCDSRLLGSMNILVPVSMRGRLKPFCVHSLLACILRPRL